MTDYDKVVQVLVRAFESIEELEVEAESTHFTAAAKADLRYALDNQRVALDMLEEEEDDSWLLDSCYDWEED